MWLKWKRSSRRRRQPRQVEVGQDKNAGGTVARAKGEDSINRNEILEKLRTHKHVLVERFDVAGLALFGSFARDQATEVSDVDILVRFLGPATSRSYFGVQFYIEDLLGRRVDLVTDKALRPAFRPYVEREALDV